MQNAEQIILKPCLSNILQIEALIEGSALITDENERAAALIIATEVFVNIVEHAKLPAGAKVCISLNRQADLKIEFVYKTTNFDTLLKKTKRCVPYFDKKSGRYRGLGLLMIENLAEKVKYKKGDIESAIIISL